MKPTGIDHARWVLIAAGALLCAAVGIVITAVLPLREEIAALEAARSARPSQAPVTTAPEARADDDLAAFRRFFEDAGARTATMARMVALARKSGVELAGGEFRIVREGDDGLTRYRMTLPVTGSYAQLRRFIGLVLEQIPTLALDDLQIRRESVEVARLEARLRFTHFGEARQ